MLSTKEPTFGARLKKLREMRGYTKRQLASMIGVAPETIRRWELELTYPNVRELKALAGALGVSEDFLLGTGGVMMATNSLESKLQGLPDEARLELEAIIDYLRTKYYRKKR